jgi:hypothetical protein
MPMPLVPLIAAAVLVVGLYLLAVALCRAAALADTDDAVDRGRNRPVTSDLDAGPAHSGPGPRDGGRGRA